MRIWTTELDIDLVNQRGRGSMSDHLEIEFMEVGDNYLVARMPISPKNRQPMGIMHGGASCVLAETVGSTAAQFCVNPDKQYCVGLDINTNHLRIVRDGYVIAYAKPFHLGQTTQVWGIDIKDERGRMISVSRLTMAVLKR